MGLLDNDGAMLGLSLLAAAGPSATPMSFGQRLYGALQQDQARRNDAEDRKQRKAMQELQMQQLLAQAARQKQADQEMQQRRNYLGAVDPSAGPAMPVSTPRALAAGLSLPEIAALQPQQADPMAGIAKIDPKDYTPESFAAFVQTRNPAVLRKAEKPDLNSLIVMGPDGRPMLNQALFDAKRRLAQAGATNVGVSYGAPVAGVADGKPVFFQPDKAGGAPAIIPGVTPPKTDKPLTESQAKAAAYRSQMETAERELSGNPIDMTKLGRQIDVGLAGGITNLIASPAAQRARQAQEQWAEAFLRFKTGAAATKDEVTLNVRTFFPQPGDGPAVIEQKRRARAQAAKDVSFAAGSAPHESPDAAPANNVVDFGSLK